MERLTRRSATGHAYYPRCFEAPCDGEGCKIRDCLFNNTICERLAAYEDTGLTPDVCAEYRKFEDEVVASGKTFGRLLELLRADTDGRVAVLPCKVGDTVYRVFAPGDRKPVIQETQVKTSGEAAGLVGRIGETSRLVSVFLTRGEAEKALEAWTHGTD